MKTSQFTRFTGAAAIAVGTAKVTNSVRPFVLRSIRIHLNAAATQETLTIALDAAAGAAYDTTIVAIPMAGIQNLIVPFDPELQFASGDVITAAWTNTDTKTYGLVFEWGLPDKGGI